MYAQNVSGDSTKLDLVIRRLEDERGRIDDRSLAAQVEQAYTAARAAWQGVHDALNDWPRAHSQALDTVRSRLLEALEVTDAASLAVTG